MPAGDICSTVQPPLQPPLQFDNLFRRRLMAVSNDGLSEITNRVQGRFLSLIETDGKEEFDSRDIHRVRTNTEYVSKFVRQVGGDESKAYNMLVEAMKWRKSFGANDLDQSCVSQGILDMGLAFPRGVDRDGNVVVILNIRFHRKDNFQPIQLHQFVVYCLETHLKFFPDKRVTMLFDMSETGITNLDLDFIRFFITCFRQYYPGLLAILLVYELPWILQAAWKIVKSWLGDRAAKKIKFVTKATITEYIDPTELLERYGGQDKWIYTVAGITDNMRSLANRICKRPDESSLSPEISNLLENLESSVKVMKEKNGVKEGEAEEIIDESKEDLDGATMKKQVRFSGDTKITSSHRSRYNNDPSTQIRRRHVEKLLGMQSPPKKMATVSLVTENAEAAAMDSDCVSESDIEASIVGVRPSHLLEAGNSSLSDLPSLEISPQKQIQFTKDANGVLSSVLKLTNQHDINMAFKVKTTAPSRYKVKPSLGYVPSHGHNEILLRISPGMEAHLHSVTEDKFLVQSCVVDLVPVGHVKQSFLASQWKTFPKDKMTEHLLRCSIVESETTAADNSGIVTSTPLNNTDLQMSPFSAMTPSHPSTHLDNNVTLKTKVDELIQSCQYLDKKLFRLILLQLLTLLLLVVLIILAFIF